MPLASDQSPDVQTPTVEESLDGPGDMLGIPAVDGSDESMDDLRIRLRRAEEEVSRLRTELTESRRGYESFESLFRISPIPLMEQDYTLVEEWMEHLRAGGVTDILDYLGDNIERIRQVVPLIRIVAANPAAVRAVGLPAEEIIGPIDPRIVNQGSQPSWLSQLEAVWERKPVSNAAFTAGTPDGKTYDAESILSAPLVDGEPDYSRAVFTLIDVTPHREEERRMEELVVAKNRFLATVSHEIRTPLTAIVGFGQLLEDDPDLDPDDRRHMITAIVHQSQEVADLIDDLLVAARAELGQIEVVERPVDLVAQIESILEAGGSYAAGVRRDAMPDEASALGDPARVRQIIRNLLTNAERYGGDDVAIAVVAGNDTLTVEVSDDGAGLPTAEWERIFELYERAHSPLVEQESLGIGLAISRELAQLMGGSLSYVREKGRSIFRLKLRMHRA